MTSIVETATKVTTKEEIMVNQSLIAQKVKEIRESAGLSRNELAEALSVSVGKISNLENAHRGLDILDYLKICEACNIPDGIFRKDLRLLDCPEEIAPKLTELREVLIELHKLCISDESPVDVYLKEAKYWLPIMREIAKKDPIPYVKEARADFVADSNEQHEPIKNDDAFKFSPESGIKELKLIKDTFVSIRKYSRACAGNTGFTDETPDYLPYYVDGFQGDSTISLMEIGGDSMSPLIEDGETVVVRELPDHPRITSEDHVPLSAFREKIPHGAICILNHNDTGQQVKQLFYSGKDENWGLIISSANTSYEKKILRKGQSLVIYGIVLGKALV